jgi:hypothetical protein
MTWSSFWQKHDPDDVFAYSTIKLVNIRDRYLGLLHHVFQLAVVIYIIGVVIFYQVSPSYAKCLYSLTILVETILKKRNTRWHRPDILFEWGW